MERMYEEYFFKDHQTLALFVLFEDDEELYDRLVPKNQRENIKNLIERIKKGEEKTGIIVSVIDGKPQFIHHTFIEYFVAEYFWKLFISTPFNEFENIFKNIIIECLILQGRKQICKFFQSIQLHEITTKNIEFIDYSRKIIYLLKYLVKHSIEKTFPSLTKEYSLKLLWSMIETSFSYKEYGFADSEIFSIINNLENDEQLKVLTIAVEMNYQNLANFLIEKLDKNFVLDYYRNSSRDTPLWIAAKNNNLNILKYIYEKFMDSKRTARDFTGRYLLEKILRSRSFNVLENLMELNILNVNYLYCEKLPLLEIMYLRPPDNVLKLFIRNLDINSVNQFKHFSNLKYSYDLAICACNYNENIIDFIMKKGINLSLGMNFLFEAITKENAQIANFMPYNFDHDELFAPDSLNLNICDQKIIAKSFEAVEKLLKYGVGFNCLNTSSKLTTIKYVENIIYILKFFDRIFKIQNQETVQNCSPIDLILKHILNFINQINKGLLTWDIELDDEGFSIKFKTEKIIYLFPKQFRTINLSNKDLTTGKLNESYLCANSLRDAMQSLKKCNDINFASQSSYQIIRHDSCNSLNQLAKNLLRRLLEYYKERSEDIEIFLENLTQDILKINEVFHNFQRLQNSKLKGNSYKIDELYHIFNLEAIKIDDELQDILYKLENYQNIERIVNFWEYFNFSHNENNIMNKLESISNNLNYSLEILELFENLNSTFLQIFNEMKNGNHQEIRSIINTTESNFKKSILNSYDANFGTLLHYAVYNSDVESIQILLSNGVNPNSQLSHYCKDLFNCTSSNFEEYYKGCMPLHLATEIGNKEIIKLLLNKGSDVNGVDWFQRTPLYYAIRAGKLDIVKYLVEEKSANLSIIDIKDTKPLNYAKNNEKLEIVRYIETKLNM